LVEAGTDSLTVLLWSVSAYAKTGVVETREEESVVDALLNCLVDFILLAVDFPLFSREKVMKALLTASSLTASSSIGTLASKASA